MYGGAVLEPDQRADAASSASCTTNRAASRFPGFYDGVREIPAEGGAGVAGPGVDERDFLAGAASATPRGEGAGRSLERIWSRPTCDINGIWGGYTGAGSQDRDPAPRLGASSPAGSCRTRTRARCWPRHRAIPRGAAAGGLPPRDAGLGRSPRSGCRSTRPSSQRPDGHRRRVRARRRC